MRHGRYITRMLKPGSYDHVAKSCADVPPAAFARFRRELCARLGGSVGEMFPEFARAFPSTVRSIEAHWPRPVAVLHQWMGDWLSAILLERPDLNLFFKLTSPSWSEYDEDYEMLPRAWRELYRWFDSFVVTPESIMPISWRSTPFSYPGRMNVEEYRQAVGATKRSARGFEKQIGSRALRCWVLSNSDDALFLDEERCDHRVYHLRGAAFEDVAELRDPAVILDRYMAHVVSGDPREFDFRSG